MNAFRRATAAVLAAALGALAAPAAAMDTTTHFYGLNPPSAWHNQDARDLRLGLGEFWHELFASVNGGNGLYADLAVTVSTGLYVQVAPVGTNALGALYQYEVDDANPFGVPPAGLSGTSTALSADPTLVYGQGLLSTPPVVVGPLTPPATTGHDVTYLVECQDQRVDETPQSVNTVNSQGQTTQVTADETRAEVVACQAKEGNIRLTGLSVAPGVDTGWVALATVLVPYGTSTIPSGNVVMNAAAAFTGFVPASSTGGITVAELPHGDYIGTASASQVETGNIFFGNYQVFSPSGTANSSATNAPSNAVLFQDSEWNAGTGAAAIGLDQVQLDFAKGVRSLDFLDETAGGYANANFGGLWATGLTDTGAASVASLAVSSGATVTGTTTLNGLVSLGGNVQWNGHNVTTTGNGNFGTVNATGAVNAGNLAVSGASALSGGATVAAGLGVSGGTTTDTLAVSGAGTAATLGVGQAAPTGSNVFAVTGGVAVTGASNLNGTVTTSGHNVAVGAGSFTGANATLTGTVAAAALNVSGASALSGGATVAAGLGVSGGTTTDTLAVSGAGTAATLGVGQAAPTGSNVFAVTGGVAVTGASNLNGTVTTSGHNVAVGAGSFTGANATLTGTVASAALNVSGASALSGGLTVTGGENVSGGATVAAGLGVSGGTTTDTLAVSGSATFNGTNTFNGGTVFNQPPTGDVVSSLSGLHGALGISSPDGSVTAGTSGSNVTLTAHDPRVVYGNGTTDSSGQVYFTVTPGKTVESAVATEYSGSSVAYFVTTTTAVPSTTGATFKIWSNSTTAGPAGIGIEYIVVTN